MAGLEFGWRTLLSMLSLVMFTSSNCAKPAHAGRMSKQKHGLLIGLLFLILYIQSPQQTTENQYSGLLRSCTLRT